MTIEQAEKLLDDLATQEELLCKRADDASGYTRSCNESIRTFEAKKCEERAKQFTQIAEWLDKYRQIQDIIQNYHDALYYEDIAIQLIEGIVDDGNEH